MKKAVVQGILAVLLFLGTWFALTRADWAKIFKLRQITDKTEQKLGEQLWEVFKRTEEENKNAYVTNSVDSVATHICKENKIDRGTIKVHILNKDEINAFVLPNGRLIVYTGLILNSDNQEELAGVICHEMAHIKLNHVMKKLAKEVGLSVLISMATGSEIVKETAKLLSSSAFDRDLEKEADIEAVDLMIKANVNPRPFANFLYRLSEKEHEATKYLTWFGTHPGAKERAAYIAGRGKGKLTDYKPILANGTWDKLIEELKD